MDLFLWVCIREEVFMIQIVEGDLLSANADVICQQVNCQNAMGSGLARAIYTKWPIVKEAYHEFCDSAGLRDPYSLLGRVQIIRSRELPFDIANIFGQLNYGRRNVCYTSYDALDVAFQELCFEYGGDKIIAFPYGFGCGLAGGEWTVVQNLIEKHFHSRKTLIYRKG